MNTKESLEQENEKLKKFLSMDFRYSLFYIKDASEQLKNSEALDPRHQAELLEGISLAVDKSLEIMSDADCFKA